MREYQEILENLYEVGVLHPAAEEAAFLISLDKKEEAYQLLLDQGYQVEKYDAPTSEWMWECQFPLYWIGSMIF